jgi:hypothetical protein
MGLRIQKCWLEAEEEVGQARRLEGGAASRFEGWRRKIA